MKTRQDLVLPDHSEKVKVFELAGDPDVSSAHLYMEAQICTPDSLRFVFHQSAHAHGSDQNDPRHRYLLCDLENGGRVSPLTEETGATAASVTPDGRAMYYFVNETRLGGGRLTLKRVNLDGTGRETVLVVDRQLAETGTYPSQIYPLSTIRSDGRRIAVSAFLGDGKTEGAPWGLMVFDLEHPAVSVILQGQTWCNLHPQYCRSTDPVLMRDIQVQENHGNTCDAQGECVVLVSGDGADIHLIRDDGTNFRDFPWGRDGHEQCQGHQCWRGRSAWGITSTCGQVGMRLIESLPVPHAGHIGNRTPGGRRNDLSREVPKPQYLHFQTDAAGRVMISDTCKDDDGGKVVIMELGEPGRDPFRNLQAIVHPRCTWEKDAHIHPFLSPDGTKGFFNSDESGVYRAYMITGLENVFSRRS